MAEEKSESQKPEEQAQQDQKDNGYYQKYLNDGTYARIDPSNFGRK